MTLTTRLLVFFLGLLAVVLVGFSAALYGFAWSYLHRQADERLDAATNTLVAAVEVAPDGVEWEPGERTLAMGEGVLGGQVAWIISDTQGRVVDCSTAAATDGLFAEAAAAMSHESQASQRQMSEGEQWQISQRWLRAAASSEPQEAPAQPGGGNEVKYSALAVTVGIPLGPMRAALRTLAVVLVGLPVAIWLSALMAGRSVCRKALAPVTRMAAAAQAMSAADLGERLPHTGAGDELDNLSRAFNGLLGRLQESFDRQRRFTGDASHQLRTPLTAMLGQVEVALRRPRTPDEYERALGAIQSQADHLRQIVESLLFLARADAEACLPDLERLDLTEWATQHVAMWSESPRATDLRMETGGNGSCWVKAQPAMLAELVNNLLENAVKYSQLGAPITLRVDQLDGEVQLTIEDRGCGIREDELSRVFEPFFRSADARRKGIAGDGLGLAVAARLVKAFGGRIEAGNRDGGGSRFTVSLPGAEEAPVGSFRGGAAREVPVSPRQERSVADVTIA